MKTEEKVKFIDGLVRMAARADSHESAQQYAYTAKGVLTAWNIDLTISSEDFSKFWSDIDVILKTKYEMEMNYA